MKREEKEAHGWNRSRVSFIFMVGRWNGRCRWSGEPVGASGFFWQDCIYLREMDFPGGEAKAGDGLGIDWE